MQNYRLCVLCLGLFSQISLFGQVFWSEGFGTGCNSGQTVQTFNNQWTVTNTGPNEAAANEWFVSATENGNNAGQCGSGCGNDQTLHLGANGSFLGTDLGAAYFEGLEDFCGFFDCGATDKRVESPTINCSGYNDITLSFAYIEGGNAIDNATVWYYNGAAWSLLADPAKTFSAVCEPQGIWTNFSIALPTSANNNPNVRIGFRWVNNDDGDATDPSFAVDDVELEAVANTECCTGDFNCDGLVGIADLLILLSEYGCLSGCSTDLSGDGIVGAADQLDFQGLFGNICP